MSSINPNSEEQSNLSRSDSLDRSTEGDREEAPLVSSGSTGKRWIPPTAEELAVLMPSYEIYEMLGRGGMGAVYMGLQLSLNRPVAIKILSSDLEDSDGDFAERFQNEARAMAKLEHPGIVTVYGFGQTETGLRYIVMQYVEGIDVARLMDEFGALRTDYASGITAHVCDALTYAHGNGIIHRDIKPANIMLGYDGVVRVADFGLAKAYGGTGESIGLTQSGMLMGTMHYMAPEMMILGSSEVDHRADVYAVGVMLYHMLTGRLPHGMFQLPSELVEGLDPRYDEIVERAMQENRDERYQSAAELREDLDAILSEPIADWEVVEGDEAPEALPPVSIPKRLEDRSAVAPDQGGTFLRGGVLTTKAWVAVFALVVLLLNGVGWWWYSKTGEGQEGGTFSFKSVFIPESETEPEVVPAPIEPEEVTGTVEVGDEGDEGDEPGASSPLEEAEELAADPEVSGEEPQSSPLHELVQAILGEWWQRSGMAPEVKYRVIVSEDGGATLDDGSNVQKGGWMILGDRLVFSWGNGVQSQIDLPPSGMAGILYGELKRGDEGLGEVQLARDETALFRVADWHRLPELPSAPCRLVMVLHPEIEEGQRPGSFQQVLDENPADLVKLGERFSKGDIAAISKDGKAQFWGRNGERYTQGGASPSVMAFSAEEGLPSLVWVMGNGRIDAGPQKTAVVSELQKLRGVVYASVMVTDTVFVVTNDGKRSLLGPGANHSNMLAVADRLQGVDDLCPKFPHLTHVVFEDGSGAVVNKNKLRLDAHDYQAQRFLSQTILMKRDGSAVGYTFGYSLAGVANRLPNGFEKVSNAPLMAAIKPFGKDWNLYTRGGSRARWKLNREMVGAFRGARDVKIVGNYAYALLPAETVSRSGYWNLDELIADRSSK